VSATSLKGACRCGTTRFEAAGAPLLTMACHCRGCQRMTAGPFSLSSLYEANRLSVAGETVRGGLKSGPNHSFCPECMSWLFTVPEGLEDYVNVRSSLFDDAAAHRPFIECWTSEALGWASSGAERSYATVPADEEFGELMAAYAAWDGRVVQ
jgi:hypothetical protein